MAFVLVAGVGLAALRHLSKLWAGIMMVVSLAAVGVAVMGAVVLRGKERYWWAGFAFFSGAYLALALGPWPSDRFQPKLGTTYILDELCARMTMGITQTEEALQTLRAKREELAAKAERLRAILRSRNDPAMISARASITKIDQQLAAAKFAVESNDHFQRVGHSLFSLMAGLLGGMVATRFYTRRERTGTDAP